ncbi:MAG: hypothetical protein PHI35_08620, partial [Victivallaceae bacterium]|nr:hypothetical protein [Victivallaceae bacterium]
PALNRLFQAERGKGAKLNGKPIHVSGCAKLEEAAVSTGFACLRAGLSKNNLPAFNRIAPVVRDIKRCGSAALDLCHVASGTYDAYWERELHLYDVAAGAIIAREAGATVCDFNGGDDWPAKGTLAINAGLLDRFLAYLQD